MVSSQTKVSAAIVTYNNEDKIEKTVDSILSATKNCELSFYISDNNSGDRTVALLEQKFPSLAILRNAENRGFGWAHNQVLPYLDSKYHAIINPDILLEEDALSELSSYLDEHEDVVMVTPKILNPDRTEQFLPRRRPRFRYLIGGRFERFGGIFAKWRADYTMKNQNIQKPVEIEFCTGCFMLIRTEIFQKLGGFDDRFFMYFEDADLTRRAARYGKVQFLPQYSAVHIWERASSKNYKFFMIQLQSMFKYFFKWLGKKK